MIILDSIVDVIHPHSENDYLDGEINMYSSVNMFIDKMYDAERSEYRNLVKDELLKVEMFEVLNKL